MPASLTESTRPLRSPESRIPSRVSVGTGWTSRHDSGHGSGGGCGSGSSSAEMSSEDEKSAVQTPPTPSAPPRALLAPLATAHDEDEGLWAEKRPLSPTAMGKRPARSRSPPAVRRGGLGGDAEKGSVSSSSSSKSHSRPHSFHSNQSHHSNHHHHHSPRSPRSPRPSHHSHQTPRSVVAAGSDAFIPAPLRSPTHISIGTETGVEAAEIERTERRLGLILIYLSFPAPLVALVVAIYALLVAFVHVLLAPLRLCISTRPPLGTALCATLAPALRLHLRMIQSEVEAEVPAAVLPASTTARAAVAGSIASAPASSIAASAAASEASTKRHQHRQPAHHHHHHHHHHRSSQPRGTIATLSSISAVSPISPISPISPSSSTTSPSTLSAPRLLTTLTITGPLLALPTMLLAWTVGVFWLFALAVSIPSQRRSDDSDAAVAALEAGGLRPRKDSEGRVAARWVRARWEAALVWAVVQA